MISANNKISVIVEDQLPGFIREDHDNFVQFVKSYYEFLELTNPPVDMPLRFVNPSETTYTSTNKYGAGPLLVGETINQYADAVDSTIITASAVVFAYNATATTKTVTITGIAGTTGLFIANKEIIGESSGAKYWPSSNIKQAPTGALQASYDISNIRDMDLMSNQYIDFIKKEIASGFPARFDKGIDERTALKNLRDFYQSKGTENSFRLLFRLVFGEDIDIYLPSENMLRPSVGEWEQRTTLRLDSRIKDLLSADAPRDVSDIVGQRVTGISSKATAIIERAQKIIYAGDTFIEADITSKAGTFEPDEQVRVAYIEAETNSAVTIELKNYGLISSIDITDGGSNYAIGDQVSIGGSNGLGTIARVSDVDSITGEVKAIEIIDPGYRYTGPPSTINLNSPHSGDAGSTRFEAGPLESILDVDFNHKILANSFFAESDNRGAYANTGAVGFDLYDIDGATIINPASTDANSFSNFVTVPGKDEGLQAWWKFDSYNIIGDVTVNTLDGTFGDGNDPTANVINYGYWGPRVSDSVYRPDFKIPAFGYGSLDPLKTRTVPSQNTRITNTYSATSNATSANSYNPNGWVGFKPIVLDSSGNGNHAWLQTANNLAPATNFTGRANVVSRGAFSERGIFGTGSLANTWVNGPSATEPQNDLGGIVLRAHDDLRNANTQTWVMWYYPYGEIGSFGGTYNNDTEWVQYDSEAPEFDANNAPNILSRDGGSYWALQANATSTATSDYHDVIFRFQGAEWDNGNAVNGQVANTSGQFPGHNAGTLNAGGGSLRAQTWNMIALSIDHTVGVGNLFFFNTTDGFHSSNGFSIPVTQDANTPALGTWPVVNGDAQGRAVVLGAASASANGDSNSIEQNPASSAHGRYDEVRYYDQALNQQQIAHLFNNPGGRFDNTLSGEWAIVNPAVSGNTAAEFLYDSGETSQIFRIGSDDTSTGLQVVYNKDIAFDPAAHYKLTVKARNTDAGNSSNVQFGVIGIADTGTRLLGYDAADDWDKSQPIAQSGADLGTTWVEKTAVFGGNSSPLHSGWDATGDGEGTYTWNNPAKLYGDVGAAAGNTTFFRPVLRWDEWTAGDFTEIEYVKVEVQRPATLTATIAGEFVWPGRDIGDAGKLSTSPAGIWLPKHLSDNNFYQAYSYVIQSGLSIEDYRQIVDKLVHTSGKKLFSEVQLTSKADLSLTASAFNESLIRLLFIFYGGSERLLLGPGETWDGRSLKGDVAIKSEFGLYDLPDLPFDLDLAHGEFDVLDHLAVSDRQDQTEDFTGEKTIRTYSNGDTTTKFADTISTAPQDAHAGWRVVHGSSDNGGTIIDGPNLRIYPDPEKGPFPLLQTRTSTTDYTYNIDGTEYPKIQMKIRRVSGTRDTAWTGTMFWGRVDGLDNRSPDGSNVADGVVTPRDYPYGRDGVTLINYSKNIPRPTFWGPDFHILEWDFTNDPRWEGETITELRFDFDRGATEANPTNNVYEIEYIRFVAADQFTYGSPNGPAWIAWDQSPLDNPYANGHYSSVLYPDPTYASSNSATRPTKDTLLWEVSGAYAKLVTGYEDTERSTFAGLLYVSGPFGTIEIPRPNAEGLLALDGHYHQNDPYTADENDGVNWQTSQELPLNIDSSTYRYVRMKVRRIGPGGYRTSAELATDPISDPSAWIGACQAETRDSAYGNIGANYNRVQIGGTNIGANTISQPETLIIPAGSDADTKSPWHILEWDMHDVGSGVVGANTIVADTFAANNIGWLGITLVGNPTESNETFEIDWIQVDDGTKFPRGNHQWPIGRTDQVGELAGERDQYNDGSGVGGYANTMKVNSSWDYSTRPMGQFSVAVSSPQSSEIKFANTAANNATVIYVATSLRHAATSGTNPPTVVLTPALAADQILRFSANTANSTDWISSSQISANDDNTMYSLFTDPLGAHYERISMELDDRDTIFLGYQYTEDKGSTPGTSNFEYPANVITSDSRPFYIMHYQPSGNVAPTGVIGGNTGHNFFGVSNNYISELVLYGNTVGDGYEVLGHGPRALENDTIPTLGTYTSIEEVNTNDMMINYRNHLHVVGKASQNVLLIKPAPGTTRDGTVSELLPLVLDEEPISHDIPYSDGLGKVRVGPDRNRVTGVEQFNIMTSSTIDSNGVVLGTWNPHAIIEGPKGSFFVACNNYNTSFGTDSIYCYHVVPTQNVATGEITTMNAYPVYANSAHTTDLFQGCTGMAIDNLDPPNFYYATANTIFKVEPKGYSYETGDTKITQLINSDYTFWNTNHGTGTVYPPLGKYPSQGLLVGAKISSHPYIMEGTYSRMNVDRYNRLFFGGQANVYIYDTNTDQLSIAYAPQENQTQIPTLTSVNLNTVYDNHTLLDFDVEPYTGELVFIISNTGNGRSMVGSIRPNADLSYTIADGDQLVQTIIDADITDRFYSPQPTGIGAFTEFATGPGAKIRIRKQKDDERPD